MISEQELPPSITIITPNTADMNPMAASDSEIDVHDENIHDDEENPMYESALDIKMVDSQDLKKKS